MSSNSIPGLVVQQSLFGVLFSWFCILVSRNIWTAVAIMQQFVGSVGCGSFQKLFISVIYCASTGHHQKLGQNVFNEWILREHNQMKSNSIPSWDQGIFRFSKWNVTIHHSIFMQWHLNFYRWPLLVDVDVYWTGRACRERVSLIFIVLRFVFRLFGIHQFEIASNFLKWENIFVRVCNECDMRIVFATAEQHVKWNL